MSPSATLGNSASIAFCIAAILASSSAVRSATFSSMRRWTSASMSARLNVTWVIACSRVGAIRRTTETLIVAVESARLPGLASTLRGRIARLVLPIGFTS